MSTLLHAPTPASTTPAPAFAPPTSPAPDVGAIAEVITSYRSQIDRERRLPEPVVAAMRDLGLFRLTTPAALGGLELDLVTQCAVLEDVAALDASAAWCAWNGSSGFAAALMDDDAAAEVFASPDAIVGNSARVAGQAIPDGDGFRVSGRWDLVSGSDHQSWIILFAMVMADGGPRFLAPGQPEIRAFFLRREQVEIVDKWHVLGLRGTSSNEVVVSDVLVPERLSAVPFAPMRVDRPLYRIPVFSIAAPGGAAVCLGIARAALDAASQLVATKASINGPLIERAETAAALAEADVRLRSARLAFHDALGDVMRSATASQPVSVAQRARIRSAMTLAATTSRDVTLRMFELGSSSAIYEGNPLERLVRDALTAAQHVMVQPLWYEQAGRVLLGLEPTLPVL